MRILENLTNFIEDLIARKKIKFKVNLGFILNKFKSKGRFVILTS
jgi:hypothetical protein